MTARHDKATAKPGGAGGGREPHACIHQVSILCLHDCMTPARLKA